MEYQKKALPFITLLLGCLSPFINLAAINTNDLLVIYPDIIKYFICLFSGSILIALLIYKLLSRRLALHVVCNSLSVFIVPRATRIEKRTPIPELHASHEVLMVLKE